MFWQKSKLLSHPHFINNPSKNLYTDDISVHNSKFTTKEHHLLHVSFHHYWGILTVWVSLWLVHFLPSHDGWSHGRIKGTQWGLNISTAEANSTITESLRESGILDCLFFKVSINYRHLTWHLSSCCHTLKLHDWCFINCRNNKIKHTGSLYSSSVSLRPSHANHALHDLRCLRSFQSCSSLSDLSLKESATTCQLWLVVSSFSPSTHCDTWAATLCVCSKGRSNLLTETKIWPADHIMYLNFLLLQISGLPQAVLSLKYHLRTLLKVLQSKVRQKVFTEIDWRPLKASVCSSQSACKIVELLSKTVISTFECSSHHVTLCDGTLSMLFQCGLWHVVDDSFYKSVSSTGLPLLITDNTGIDGGGCLDDISSKWINKKVLGHNSLLFYPCCVQDNQT